jgi:3-dehydroquinate dehydratase I
MLQLGPLSLGVAPRVVLALCDGVPIDDVKAALDQGADMVELRVDLFSSTEPDAVREEFQRYEGIPVLATIRSKAEGGEWNATEYERAALYKAVLPYCDAIDIELSSEEILDEVMHATRHADRLIIGSYHNFDKTPELIELEAIHRHGSKAGVDIVKVAAHCRNRLDLHTLARFALDHATRDVIVIGMGTEANLSRIFFPALGSLMTYTFLGEPTAPGQLNCEATLEYLKAFYPDFVEQRRRS